MKLQVLGCAGGIGGLEKFTTCFLLDHDSIKFAVTHLKPGQENLIMDQLHSNSVHHQFTALYSGAKFDF